MNRIDPDSITAYASRYAESVHGNLNANPHNAAILQRTAYNYRMHVREREKAERNTTAWMSACAAAAIVALAAVVLMLHFKLRARDQYIRLSKALAALRTANAPDSTKDPGLETFKNADYLRKQVRKEADAINSRGIPTYTAPESITGARIYNEIMRRIGAGESPAIESPEEWSELKRCVGEACPKYLPSLEALKGAPLKKSELETAILLKCGFTPTEMNLILNRSKGSVSSRREQLALRLLGEKFPVKVSDAIIRSL